MKNKILARITTTICFIFLVLVISACGGGESSGKTISFYTWGNETEISIFKELVAEFNNTNQDGITVKMTPVPSEDYETKIDNVLRGRNVPDVIVAGDGEIKPWIEEGGIEPLDSYVASSDVINLDKMWADGVNRYRYDINARKGGQGQLYGIMRDYSPSVLFYNIDAMNAVGITCISMSKEESIATYGDGSAYFTHDGKEYFNNQVALNWVELLSLSQKLTSHTKAPVRNDDSITEFGLYVINWFCFGWSVGANCLEWVPDSTLSTGGKYEFTLFDETKNYIVTEGNTVTVNGNTYKEGEIISYGDKTHLTFADKELCLELPSSMEAMQYFVDLSAKHYVSPKPDVTASSSDYSLFSSQKCAMLINTRYAVGVFRKTIDGSSRDSFNWDVAPLPVYEGGIAAGHSGSEAYCITKKSRNKEAAWKFIEFLSGPVGQTAFAEAGFTIPNTMELANSETFLQSDKNPKNSQIFVDAAYYQRTGDWGYLPSKAWINIWATDLNDDVLGGKMSLTILKNNTYQDTQDIIDKYYK